MTNARVIIDDPCSTCGGRGMDADFDRCRICHGAGTVPRTLATLPERAELRRLILDEFQMAHSGPEDALDESADAVLALFGLGAE